MRDVGTGTHITTLKGGSDSELSTAFSMDGSRLASGSGDGIVRLWDVEKGHFVMVLKGHYDTISVLIFSTDGSRLVSVRGKTARLVRQYRPLHRHP